MTEKWALVRIAGGVARGLGAFGPFVMMGLWLHAGTVAAADWCGEECVNIEIDAQVGLESLEEPVEEGQTDEADRAEATGYANVNAASLVQLYQFQAWLHAPLRFDLSDFGIRKADWDQTEEYLRIVRCARVDFMDVSEHGADNWSPVRLDENGRCGSWTPTESVGDVFREPWDFTYWSVRLAPLRDFTLGYGSIVDGYNATLEEDFYREGLTAEINLNRRFVLTAGLSDIIDPTVLAGRTVYRPLDSEQGDARLRETRTQLFAEVGVTAASDLNAPTRLTRPGRREEQGLLIGGFEARFRWSSIFDYSRDDYEIIRLELGGRFNKIFDRDHGAHAHLRFYYDIGVVDFYVDGEWRMLHGRYIPNYFDAHYRVQREQYPLSDAQRQGFTRQENLFTKLDFLNNLPDDETEHAYAANFRLRFWPWSAEQSAWTRDGADLWLFVEQVPGRNASGRAGTGLEFPNIADRLRLWGEFIQQGWDVFGDIFTVNNSVLAVTSRILLTDEIYLDLYFAQTWFQFEDGTYDTTNDIGFDVGFVPANL